jgi:xanthine dehydrogenase YagR molybdenum-binding subunit
MDACDQIKLKLLELAESSSAVFKGARTRPDHYYLQDGELISVHSPGEAFSISKLMTSHGLHELTAQSKTGQVPGHDEHYTYHSTGAHFVEVHVHELTGIVRVKRIVSVFDVGRVLNAKAGRSQLLGGVVFGVGAALMEELRYDSYGQASNANFADYLVPLASDIPDVDIQWLDIPDYKFNRLGCRGIGEIGITGSPAAVANAVYNATGVRIHDFPITPQKILGLIPGSAVPLPDES